MQPIGCNDSARRILASGSHQTNTCKHISKAGSARSSDSRAIGRNSATGATGEGGDYGNNGRATAEEAEGGVSGCRKLKHLGSTARGGGENARHSDGGGGRCKIIATGAINKRGQEWRDYGMEMRIGVDVGVDRVECCGVVLVSSVPTYPRSIHLAISLRVSCAECPGVCISCQSSV